MTAPRPRLLLASASPRRRELLAGLGWPFEVLVPGVDEVPWPGESPASYALRNAGDKARAALALAGPVGPGGLLVLAADTIVVCDGRILEKPSDAPHAVEMLRRLSGREHQVITGLCLRHEGGGGHRELADAVSTRVTFRTLSERDIADYVATGEPMDKAGGYAIQGGAAAFVTSVVGSHSNVIGLPLEVLRRRMAQVTGA